MAVYDIVALFAVQATARVAEAIAYTAELCVYVLCGVWIGVVRLFLAIIEWVDDQMPDVGIADNALLRAMVTGTVGFATAVGLILVLALFTEAWWLTCLFTLIVLAALIVGIMADPDREWNMPSFPGLGDKGPQMPLNV